MRNATRSSRRGQLPIVIGALLLVVAAVAVGYPLWWSHRSAAAGRRLLARAELTAQSTGTRCSGLRAAASAPRVGVPGVLSVPALGLNAPVLQGLSDAVLNVAVGHDTASPWPGVRGEAVLEAHDASYFAHLARLRVGAQVVWSTPCARSTFVVVRTSIAKPGQLVAPPASGAGLALVTCWPTNALFWTSSRYLVETRLVRTVLAPQHVHAALAALRVPRVPAPPALAALGLGLNENSQLLGTLRLTGAPRPSWVQGPEPLAVEKAALAAFFGLEKAVGAQNASWWGALAAPGVAMVRSWPVTGRVDVTISVHGSTANTVTVASPHAAAVFAVRAGMLRLERIIR